MNNTVANTILRQLGGNQFIALTGSKSFTGSENALSFRVGSNAKRITGCRIVLEVDDTYAVIFYKGANVVSTHTDVYNNQLQDIFEAQTGLYTTLRPRR